MKRIVKWFAAALCGMFTACAVITVNVYFPEKDVKQAYKSLDDMLLKQGQGKGGEKPAEQPPAVLPPAEQPPAPQPAEPKTQGMSFDRHLTFAFAPPVFAAENLADSLAVEVASMPEVLQAYDEMNARLPQLNALRDSGVVGLSNQGLIVVRDAARIGSHQAFVKAENESRKTVITAMAKAILKLNKQPATEANLKQVLGQAAATFAETKRDEARPGWWIQLANGRWVQK
ncbi:MAG TPA: DUF1318 domain-containing protein [Geobacteraceae bacterium]